MTRWLKIVGIGEDGLDSLTAAARSAIADADVLVGGDRHHAFVPDFAGERLTWNPGISGMVEEIACRRGQKVCVLASGDPMDFGIGTVLSRHLDPAELEVFPAPGAFALACARMAWSRPAVACVTVHGRALDKVRRHLAPGARLLVLACDGTTAHALANLLTDAGYGLSQITALEHLGGPKENRFTALAESIPNEATADLVTLAVDCAAAPGANTFSAAPGLPDDAFEHDGQITKREVRAATLAALAPIPGQLLWDIGAGSGSIAIEWLRVHENLRAVTVEKDPSRAATIAANAARLGVPELRIVEGTAPDVFPELTDPPDAIFLGGGVSQDGMLAACLDALRPGGRLVANAVTLQAEAALLAFHGAHGGDLTRIAVSRPKTVGPLTRWQPLAPITQYCGVKP